MLFFLDECSISGKLCGSTKFEDFEEIVGSDEIYQQMSSWPGKESSFEIYRYQLLKQEKLVMSPFMLLDHKILIIPVEM